MKNLLLLFFVVTLLGSIYGIYYFLSKSSPPVSITAEPTPTATPTQVIHETITPTQPIATATPQLSITPISTTTPIPTVKSQ